MNCSRFKDSIYCRGLWLLAFNLQTTIRTSYINFAAFCFGCFFYCKYSWIRIGGWTQMGWKCFFIVWKIGGEEPVFQRTYCLRLAAFKGLENSFEHLLLWISCFWIGFVEGSRFKQFNLYVFKKALMKLFCRLNLLWHLKG